MKKNKFILLSLVFFIVSCKNKLNETMVQTVDQQLVNNNCEISFKHIISERWKELYIFDPNITQIEINEAIGLKYNGSNVPDNQYLIIVSDGKKIIKEEFFNTFRLVFHENDSNGVVKISYNDFFCAEKNTYTTPCFYYLKLSPFTNNIK
jgi:hypothetical protein